MMLIKCRNGLSRILCYCLTIMLLGLIFLYRDDSSPYRIIKKINMYRNLRLETVATWPSSEIYDFLECDYSVILTDSDTGPVILPSSLADISISVNNILEGGQYFPEHCKPRISTAIIVPFTHGDKLETLYLFIKYMHAFLRRQDINYRLFVIEQDDVEPYNKAKLLNIGASYAIEDGYPCLVLHDMNFVPEKVANLYGCTLQPRIMTSDTYRYGFLKWSTSNAVAITAKQFIEVNGVSNKNENWVRNLEARLAIHNKEFCQFEPDINMYRHLDDNPAAERFSNSNPKMTKEEISKDGLNSMKNPASRTMMHPQFTHIMVDLKPL